MKKWLFSAWLWLSVVPLLSQTIEIRNRYRLFDDNRKGFHPVLNTAGNLLAFTSENYDGLWVYDCSNQSVVPVSDEPGAGFQPVFSEEGKIVYKNTVYKSKLKYDGLKSYDWQKKTVTTLLEPQRDLKPVQKDNQGVMALHNQQLLKVSSGKPEKTTPPYVWSDGRNLNIYTDGKTTVLNPVEDANGYIWASLSPNGKWIVFNAVAAGTYISDLKGNIIASLGYLNAPVWYGNEFVVGMQDKDDGYNVTESIVVMKSLNGKQTKQLSEPGQIAMYPTAAPIAQKVAYHTVDGDIYVVELNIIP
jgi:Tol biopolymer transport system component